VKLCKWQIGAESLKKIDLTESKYLFIYLTSIALRHTIEFNQLPREKPVLQNEESTEPFPSAAGRRRASQ
jgi:hypothetical protein